MTKSILFSLLMLVLLHPATEGFAQCTAAAVPYYENFGGGVLDASWRTESTHGPLTQPYRLIARPPGRIQVTDLYNPFTPAARPFQLAMDDPLADPFIRRFGDVYNAALLCAEMGGATGMYLHFHGYIYSAKDARKPLSVYLSDNNGASFTLMDRYDGDLCPSGFFCPVNRVQTWESLDWAARDAGLALTDDWVIGFEHATDGALTDDGVTIDSVAISRDPGPVFEPIDLGDPREDHDRTLIDCPAWHPACQPMPCDGIDCPYFLDFEQRFIDPRMKLLSVNGGTTTIGEDDRGYHLRLQALEGVGKQTINVASFGFDFSKLDPKDPDTIPAIMFSWQALDRQSNSYDGVYLSDDGGASYVKVHDLDRTDAPLGKWRTVQLDLHALVDKHGLTYSDDFVVAFAHYALGGEGKAGYALDDLMVGRLDGKAGKTGASNPGLQPDGFVLEANYPNPFNPTTTLAFSLPSSQPVTLTVYDLTGRVVATLVDGLLSAGSHTVTFRADHLPSGTYLYRLDAGPFSQTRRLTLLK